MSLSLLQSYSSDEEEENLEHDDLVDEEDGGKRAEDPSFNRYQPLLHPNPSSVSALLPSALEAFSEVSGPPQFLNKSADEVKEADAPKWRHGRRRNRRDIKTDLPVGAVLESKAQLIGVHERVRSDVEGGIPLASSSRPTTESNGDAKKAAELARMCLTCGVPKTYTSEKGTICPICEDDESKKRAAGSVKDKEKLKRMKGQSSHATWKSETEMHLRQQFD